MLQCSILSLTGPAPFPYGAFAAVQHNPATTAQPLRWKNKVDTKMENPMKVSEDLVAFGKGNVDALMQASQVWTAGVQALAKDVIAATQAQIEQTAANMKSLAAVKSPKELLDLHTALTRSAVEAVIAETTRLSEASTKLANEALAPLTARLTEATQTFGVKS